jgi:DNA mismatch repair protein MutS
MEVTRPHLNRVPEDYVRKQTVAGGERFFTPALKEQEERISNAQERAAELESAIFRQVCKQVGDDAEAILASARAVARLDVLASFAETASRYRYVRPVLDGSRALEIAAGRHPVVERALEAPFVPNDARLTEEVPIAILTGPNMAGKSTYLRQVALIALMAQTGGFVPAQSARIGLVDRIFTRAGLQDDISTGRSTFMVEMTETAYILNQATARSLIILDEIGRGTSTYDGLAIAWAVVEHIHNHPRLGARTLFATHYHELVELGDSLPKAANFHVAVSEEEGKVVFLRRVLPGGADRSYGVHVAQLAGLPRDVVARAQDVLAHLEDTRGRRRPTGIAPATHGPRKGRGQLVPTDQPALFTLTTAPPTPARLEEALRRLDIDQMTPLEALAKLYDLRRMLEDGNGK